MFHYLFFVIFSSCIFSATQTPQNQSPFPSDFSPEDHLKYNGLQRLKILKVDDLKDHLGYQEQVLDYTFWLTSPHVPLTEPYPEAVTLAGHMNINSLARTLSSCEVIFPQGTNLMQDTVSIVLRVNGQEFGATIDGLLKLLEEARQQHLDPQLSLDETSEPSHLLSHLSEGSVSP